MIIVIGEKTFPSIKTGKEYIRCLLSTLGESDIYAHQKEYAFFVDLIDHHTHPQQKIGDGIKCFQIRQNKLNKKGFETSILRNNNTISVFSWNSCVCIKPEKDRQDEDAGVDNKSLKCALRNSIRDQIEEFILKTSRKECSTPSMNCSKNFHVDHKTIPFNELVKYFFTNTRAEKPKRLCCGIANRPELPEGNFKDVWNQYHKKNADYQYLCSYHNIKKSDNVKSTMVFFED